ncbi:hypothetical protein FRC02_011515 [Tulasnella sp. 418]|nr:hypothetical protein FRC02_011515 [Tulasnella sp. 418]
MTFKLPLFLLALTGPLITVTAGPVNPAPDLLNLEGPIRVPCPHVSRGFESDRIYTVVVTGTERNYHDKWLNRCFYAVTYSPSRFSKNTETAVVSTAVDNQWIGEGDVAGFKKIKNFVDAKYTKNGGSKTLDFFVQKHAPGFLPAYMTTYWTNWRMDDRVLGADGCRAGLRRMKESAKSIVVELAQKYGLVIDWEHHHLLSQSGLSDFHFSQDLKKARLVALPFFKPYKRQAGIEQVEKDFESAFNTRFVVKSDHMLWLNGPGKAVIPQPGILMCDD